MKETSRGNILHIIPRMVQGGAEKLLLDFLRSDALQHNHQLLVLFSDSDRRMIEPIADKVTERAANSYSDVARDIPGVRKWIAQLRPDAVVAWMYHASVLAPVLVPGGIPILAYLHNTDLSAEAKRAERLAQKALARLARSSRMSMLYCGAASQRFHEDSLGYPSARPHVLANGVSLEIFTPDPARRRSTRVSLGIETDALTFGCFGRFNPQKNWPLVLDAVAKAAEANSDVRLIAAGRGVSLDNPEFAALVAARDLQKRVLALGARSDMAPLYDAIDVLLLGSRYGESSPLVLLEALAMGKPAIATALGSIPEVLEGLVPPIQVNAPKQFVSTAVDAAVGRWPGLVLKADTLRNRSISRYGLQQYCAGLDAVAGSVI